MYFVWNLKLLSCFSKAKYILPMSFSLLWWEIRGQVLSFRHNTSFGCYHMHVESYEMPISYSAISVGTVSAVVQTVFAVLQGSSCGTVPCILVSYTPRWPHAAECDIHDFSLLLATHSLHQLKRLWQISSWPRDVPLQQPKREPQLLKQSICRQRLVAQARWGVSCLVQYVLVLLLLYCYFIDCLLLHSAAFGGCASHMSRAGWGVTFFWLG